MTHDAFSAMHPSEVGNVRLWAVWKRIWLGLGILWGCSFLGIFTGSGVTAAAAAIIPADLTTEHYIYTGPTTTARPPPPPPKDFEITYKEAFASFVHLTIKYNITYNFTKAKNWLQIKN
ncbi:hypothetical protein SK128_007802 [Halocaridina rubra]|uniref:Uncharacterized protein n=1 Tax=Halocaridina rubra TaxID=373956 RepID=A0AAN9A602_HALRR